VDGYDGIGPQDARTGDLVALFAGATRPMIIRSQGDEYRLHGPAIVHGIMNGEAWPEDANSALQRYVLV
jgi:serine phosphatase RsbU (regulator of sigma subunit)